MSCLWVHETYGCHKLPPPPYFNNHLLTHSPIHSQTHSLTHSHLLTHPPTHPLTHPLTYSLTHSPTHPPTYSPTHPYLVSMRGAMWVRDLATLNRTFATGSCASVNTTGSMDVWITSGVHTSTSTWSSHTHIKQYDNNRCGQPCVKKLMRNPPLKPHDYMYAKGY